MFRTRLCVTLGIDYPIVQGGLQWLSRAGLVAAVSEAGGLGVLCSAMFYSRDEFKGQIRMVKSLTRKPFAVNINLFPSSRHVPVRNEEYIDLALEEGVQVFETTGRSPEKYMRQIKDGGAKVIHKVARVRDAISAQNLGCDAVTMVSYEAGGNYGLEDTTAMVKIPQTVAAVIIPVIASGGIVDGKGFLAALALGAEGVLMGTRFMLTKECPLHPRTREWMLNARSSDTVTILASVGKTRRALSNKAAERIKEMERRGTTIDELAPIIDGQMGRRSLLEGDIDAGVVACGQAVGLIDDVPSAGEVVRRTIDEATRILSNRLCVLV